LCELLQKSPEKGDKEQWHKALATWKTGNIKRQSKNEQGQWRNRSLADIKSDAKTEVIRRVKELAESHDTSSASDLKAPSSSCGVPPPTEDADTTVGAPAPRDAGVPATAAKGESAAAGARTSGGAANRAGSKPPKKQAKLNFDVFTLEATGTPRSSSPPDGTRGAGSGRIMTQVPKKRTKRSADQAGSVASGAEPPTEKPTEERRCRACSKKAHACSKDCILGHELEDVRVDGQTDGCRLCEMIGWLWPDSAEHPEADRTYTLDPHFRDHVRTCKACGFVVCDSCMSSFIFFEVKPFLPTQLLAKLCR